MIRVTSGAYADRLISNLGSITARQARYQAQISTCQRVTLPEDDPGAVRRALSALTVAAFAVRHTR
jgi:flagellin-like hook-associated protein FlgL